MIKLKNNYIENYLLNLSNKLSEINQFETFPNPCVGAVAIDNKNQITMSFTGKGGSPHAEKKLLQNIKPNSISTLFTSLEPCSHYGKNPPCVDLIIKKKIKKIITGTKDFDERVNKKSFNKLKDKKILLKYKNFASNSSYLHNYSKKLKIPYVVAKIATSHDGFTKHRNKKLFTSHEALKFAHLIRYQSDSILVGKNTVNDDNPSLDCRLPGLEKKIQIFIINKNLNFNSKVILNKKLKGAYVFHSSKNLKKIKKYKNFFKLIELNFSKKNFHCDLLTKVNNLGFRKLLIEGGITTLKFFLKNNLINEIFHVINDQKFNNNGLLHTGKLLKNKNLPLNSLIHLEHDLILNYKRKYVYRNNSINSKTKKN